VPKNEAEISSEGMAQIHLNNFASDLIFNFCPIQKAWKLQQLNH